MSECCQPSGYRNLFNRREARRCLRGYDRRGLDGMAAQLADYLVSKGIEGHTVLEVGGGIGAMGVELLKAGAAHVTNVELSDGYEEAASELLDREGLADRATRALGDFTDIAGDFEADHLVMNRVLCCYPDMERLMSAAISSTRRSLAATYPRDRLGTRLAVAMGNGFCRLRGVDFRAFVHSPERIEGLAAASGFEPAFRRRGFVWHGVVFERAVRLA